jgi:uncharacterized protein (DUF885 family)
LSKRAARTIIQQYIEAPFSEGVTFAATPSEKIRSFQSATNHRNMRSKQSIQVPFLFITIIAACTVQAQQSPSQRLASITANYWNDLLRVNPLTSTEKLDGRYDDQMEISIGQPYFKQSIALDQRYLDSLKTIDFKKLSEQDLLVAEILQYKLNTELEGYKIGIYSGGAAERPVDQFVFSFPTSFASMASGKGAIPFRTVKDYDNWNKRMKIFPTWIDVAIENMNKGISKGYTSPRAAMLKVPPQLKPLFEGVVDSSIFYKPILAMPDSFSTADKERLKQEYLNTINTFIRPAYKKLHDYFIEVYIPKCRTTTGLIDNAGGKKEYQYWIAFWTNSGMSPDEIFDLGIREVARIRKEMDSLKRITGFTGDLPAFFEYVRTDRKFFPFKTEEEVLDRFRSFKVEMEPALKREFNLVPKVGFEIRATEKFRQAGANAQYKRPSPDGKRPGVFYEVIPDAATYNYAMMETLFLHEGIPGHHFQIGLQLEMEAPEFMKNAFFGAFSEGWGLYAETLGKELGMYKDPYQYLGRLNADIERSVRLVVDVGMHSKGWTREQAIQYVLDNQPVTKDVAEQRIERYMVVPGQALSYKIGEQKILALRKLAQDKLGSSFDIREFHDQILKDGAMPLTILEKKIQRWIDSKKK